MIEVLLKHLFQSFHLCNLLEFDLVFLHFSIDIHMLSKTSHQQRFFSIININVFFVFIICYQIFFFICIQNSIIIIAFCVYNCCKCITFCALAWGRPKSVTRRFNSSIFNRSKLRVHVKKNDICLNFKLKTNKCTKAKIHMTTSYTSPNK